MNLRTPAVIACSSFTRYIHVRINKERLAC